MSEITDEYIEEKIEEITEILDDYDVMAHDAEAIIGIVEHLGTLLIEKRGEGQNAKGSTTTTS